MEGPRSESAPNLAAGLLDGDEGNDTNAVQWDEMFIVSLLEVWLPAPEERHVLPKCHE